MQSKSGRERLENEDIGVKETITLVVERGLMFLTRKGIVEIRTDRFHTEKNIPVVESKGIEE